MDRDALNGLRAVMTYLYNIIDCIVSFCKIASRQIGGAVFKYDVFISYRHGDPDRNGALRLDSVFKKARFRVALDERDFRVEQSFLNEMTRCVQESAFTLALLSRRYMESANTLEEAVMTRVLDGKERQKRLIACYLEPCEPPLWMSNLVGVRLYDRAAPVPPIKRLIQTIREGLPGAKVSDSEINSISREWPREFLAPVAAAGAAAAAIAAIGAAEHESDDVFADGDGHHDHGGPSMLDDLLDDFF
jgi:hypothetical protein